jgi:hypothetical protein
MPLLCPSLNARTRAGTVFNVVNFTLCIIHKMWVSAQGSAHDVLLENENVQLESLFIENVIHIILEGFTISLIEAVSKPCRNILSNRISKKQP